MQLPSSVFESIATLRTEIEYLKRDIEEQKNDCIVRDNIAMAEIEELKKERDSIKKYGWVSIGAIGTGMIFIMGIEKAKKAFEWLIS